MLLYVIWKKMAFMELKWLPKLTQAVKAQANTNNPTVYPCSANCSV